MKLNTQQEALLRSIAHSGKQTYYLATYFDLATEVTKFHLAALEEGGMVFYRSPTWHCTPKGKQIAQALDESKTPIRQFCNATVRELLKVGPSAPARAGAMQASQYRSFGLGC